MAAEYCRECSAEITDAECRECGARLRRRAETRTMSFGMRLGLAVMLTGTASNFFPEIPRIHPHAAYWLMLGGTFLFALSPWRDDSRSQFL